MERPSGGPIVSGLPEPRPQDLIRRSLALAAVLAAAKAAAGLRANSLGLIASALDSLTDFLASALNLYSLRLSERPPDAAHPYGRGKAEALAGLAQGGFIALSALGLLAESLRRVLRGAQVSPGAWGLAVMAFSAAASLWHSRSLSRAQAATQSTVLRTESAHFGVDFLSNLGVLIALGAVMVTGRAWGDVLISVAITLYILREAYRVLAFSAQEILDRGLPEETLREIETTIRGHHPQIVGFHNLRARRSGPRVFIDFHIEIRDVRDFTQAHEITEDLIDRIRRSVPNADVTVHYDPEGGR